MEGYFTFQWGENVFHMGGGFIFKPHWGVLVLMGGLKKS